MSSKEEGEYQLHGEDEREEKEAHEMKGVDPCTPSSVPIITDSYYSSPSSSLPISISSNNNNNLFPCSSTSVIETQKRFSSPKELKKNLSLEDFEFIHCSPSDENNCPYVLTTSSTPSSSSSLFPNSVVTTATPTPSSFDPSFYLNNLALHSNPLTLPSSYITTLHPSSNQSSFPQSPVNSNHNNDNHDNNNNHNNHNTSNNSTTTIHQENTVGIDGETQNSSSSTAPSSSWDRIRGSDMEEDTDHKLVKMRIISHNVWGHFVTRAPNKVPRVRQLVTRLGELPEPCPDLILLQELFVLNLAGWHTNYEVRDVAIVEARKALNIQHFAVTSDPKMGQDSGLVVMSRYPIIKKTEAIWSPWHDIATQKGILHVEIDLLGMKKTKTTKEQEDGRKKRKEKEPFTVNTEVQDPELETMIGSSTAPAQAHEMGGSETSPSSFSFPFTSASALSSSISSLSSSISSSLFPTSSSSLFPSFLPSPASLFPSLSPTTSPSPPPPNETEEDSSSHRSHSHSHDPSSSSVPSLLSSPLSSSSCSCASSFSQLNTSATMLDIPPTDAAHSSYNSSDTPHSPALPASPPLSSPPPSPPSSASPVTNHSNGLHDSTTGVTDDKNLSDTNSNSEDGEGDLSDLQNDNEQGKDGDKDKTDDRESETGEEAEATEEDEEGKGEGDEKFDGRVNVFCLHLFAHFPKERKAQLQRLKKMIGRCGMKHELFSSSLPFCSPSARLYLLVSLTTITLTQKKTKR
jgi:hypothetical protein